MMCGIVNYVMILIQFRYNDKQLLAHEMAMTTTSRDL